MSEVSDKITKILEDPESLKMISQIAESFMADSGNENKPENDSISLNAELTKREISNEMKNNTGSIKILSDLVGKGNVDNSIMLINALKPYMSTRRSESADYVLKVLKLLKVLEKSNFSEISKLINIIN